MINCCVKFSTFTANLLTNTTFSMSQHNIPDGLFHEVWQLYSNGHTSDEILARLMKREVDLEVAEGVMSKVKTIRDAKRRSRGLVLCIIGGSLLIMAFYWGIR